MNNGSKAFYAKVEKYGGWHQVPADRIHVIFEDVLKPAGMGFVLAKRGHWARRVNSDICDVLKLDRLKGAGCGMSYGLSLSYVPYPYVPLLKWHRTLKSVSLDLREQPQVHLAGSIQTNGRESLVADTMLGEKCLREELERIWTVCASKISAWFESAHSLQGILAKCDEHLRRSPGEVKYIPGARLVRAFTHAKLGNVNEATGDLNIFLHEHQEQGEARRNLHAALAQISSHDSGSAD